MKNLTDFIAEQLIMELSSNTYRNASDKAKGRGEFDRALKFTRAELDAKIKELKAAYKEKEENNKDDARRYAKMHQYDQEYTPDDWYRDYHKEIIKLIHSDDVLEVNDGQILFKSGLLIGGWDNKKWNGQEFLPLDFTTLGYGIGVQVGYMNVSGGKVNKDDFKNIISYIGNKNEKSKDTLIKKAKKYNIPQEIVDQAIDFCKNFGFMK